MLRHVQAVDAGLVGGLRESQPLVKQRGERPVGRFDVIEQSDFHSVLNESPARGCRPCRRESRSRSPRRPGRYGGRTWRRNRGGSAAPAACRRRGGGGARRGRHRGGGGG